MTMGWVAGGVAVAGLASAYMGAQASKSAAQTQADAANNAIGANQQALTQQSALSQPYRTAGETAQNKLMQYLGLSSPTGTTTTSGGQTLDNFDSAAYLAANPDVAAQIGKPGVESAWAHYMNYGQNEGRAFTPTAAASTANTDYTTSPDYGKYTTAEFGGVPGFDSSTLMQDFGGVQGFDPTSLMNNFTMADFQADPGYAFRLKEGMNAMNATAAARGGLISGNALKAGQQYGQEMGSQEYNNAFNRYNANRAIQSQEYSNAYNRFSANRAVQGQEYGNAFNRFQTERGNTLAPYQNLAASGQAAAAGQASNIGNMANANATLSTGAANATAAGQVGSANAYTNALNTGVNQYQTSQLMNMFGNKNTSAYGTNPGAGGVNSLNAAGLQYG